MDIVRAKKAFVISVGLLLELLMIGLAAVNSQQLVQTILAGIGVLIGVDTWRTTKRI